jgi:hypothetical protein
MPTLLYICIRRSLIHLLTRHYPLQAPGIPLSQIPSPYPRALLESLAKIVLKVSKLRFPGIGSIYGSTSWEESKGIIGVGSSGGKIPIPSSSSSSVPGAKQSNQSFTLGPIISWPFFGSTRGLLPQSLLHRGPWRSTGDYLEACSKREVDDVIRENEGRVKGRRPMRRPRMRNGRGEDEGAEESEGGSAEEEEVAEGEIEVDGEEGQSTSLGSSPVSTSSSLDPHEDPEDTFYRDYRASQRSTFLVAHTGARERSVRGEMSVVLGVFGRLLREWEDVCGEEEFGIDLHDLSRENVFVDPDDWTKVVSDRCRCARADLLTRILDLYH